MDTRHQILQTLTIIHFTSAVWSSTHSLWSSPPGLKCWHLKWANVLASYYLLSGTHRRLLTQQTGPAPPLLTCFHVPHSHAEWISPLCVLQDCIGQGRILRLGRTDYSQSICKLLSTESNTYASSTSSPLVRLRGKWWHQISSPSPQLIMPPQTAVRKTTLWLVKSQNLMQTSCKKWLNTTHDFMA